MAAQVHEWLILDGEVCGMTACPPVPRSHPRIVEVDRETLMAGEDADTLTTACLRGYIGTWEIKDNRFYLAGIRGRFKLVKEGPIPADWFNGTLTVPRGELLHYVHMAFESRYEQELLITIEKGIVMETRIIDHKPPLNPFR